MSNQHHKKPRLGFAKRLPERMALGQIIRLLDWCVEKDCDYKADGKPSPCWLYEGHKDVDGYPEFKWRGKKFRACRVAYHAFRGDTPEAMDVDHLCFNRACINPDHLTLETPSINRGRHQAKPATTAVPF